VEPYPAPRPAGRQLHSGERVDGGEAGRPEARDIADHDVAPGPREECPDGVAEPGYLVRGDESGQHEYGRCRGIHSQ
jgi:hypothetical protein